MYIQIIKTLFLILPTCLIFTGCAERMLYPIDVNNRYGYIDHTGKVIIEPVYEYAGVFRNGVGWVYSITKEYKTVSSDSTTTEIYEIHFINTKGEKAFSIVETSRNAIISSLSTYVGVVSENLIVIGMYRKTNDYYHVYNYQYYGIYGTLAFTNIYESAYDFSYGLASVKIDDKWGCINKKGELVVCNIFDFISTFFTDNRAIVRYDGKCGVIDRSGQFMIPPQYGNILYYPDSHFPKTPFLLASLEEKYDDERFGSLPYRCFIGINGQRVFSETFRGARCFSEGLACVMNESRKHGYINRKGGLVIPYQFDSAYDFSEGLASVRIDGKWGYINRSGEIVIPVQFDEVEDFCEGRAKVKNGEKFGYIDKSGKLVIPVQFDSAEDFRGSLAYVRIGDEYGYIDKKGRFVWKVADEK